MIYTDIISFLSSYTIGTPFALLTLQMMKTHISLKRRNNKGSTLTCSLRRRRNLTSVSNVCEAVPRSLFYFRAPTESTNYRKGVSNFLSILLANRQWLLEQIMACTQILVHKWGPTTKISELFRRGT